MLYPQAVLTSAQMQNFSKSGQLKCYKKDTIYKTKKMRLTIIIMTFCFESKSNLVIYSKKRAEGVHKLVSLSETNVVN